MYHEIQPGDLLRPFVDCVWTLRSELGATEMREGRRILPDGCADLVLTLGKGVEVFGPTSSFRLVPRDRDFIGVRLRIGAAGVLLGATPTEICNKIVSLDMIWGNLGRRLEERLLAETTPEGALTILEKALESRLANSRGLDRVVLGSVSRLQSSPNTKVSQLAADAGLSERQLRRRFEHHVGLSMKEIGRIVRFQRVVDELRRQRPFSAGQTGWADVAIGHGYADQAHLIRESRAMAGVTPTELLNAC
jgi:AraC-like DNA-binding protein